MFSVNFQTTSNARLPPPALPAAYSWDSLVDLLTREIGPQVSRLLAEPRNDAQRDETHWFVETDHDPRAFARLGPREQSALKAKLADIAAKVEARADELDKSAHEKDRREAEALRAVLAVPDDDCLWSLDGEPLLSCWGRRPLGAGHASPRILRAAPGPVNPPVAPRSAIIAQTAARASEDAGSNGAASATLVAPVAARPAIPFWLLALLLWIVFVALVLVAYAELLAACGVAVPGRPGACWFDRASGLAAARSRNADLRQALRDRSARLAALPPCSPAAPGPATGVPDRGEVEKRLHEAQVSHGRFDIALAWNGHADLDLHVITPCGEIQFNALNLCQGRLDHDANGPGETLEDRPVEHVTWTADPPKGHYKIVADYFGMRGGAPAAVPYTVVVQDGDAKQTYNGVLTAPKEHAIVVEFDR